jgi:carnitine monooxygenase subunit
VSAREQLVAMARENIAHVKAGTIPQEPDVFRVPTLNYYGHERWEREIEAVFKRLPLMLALTAEMRNPGDYKAMEAAGVPVLLTRGADGVVRGFYNICSHRAAVLVEEGNGSARRFACPYHAWTYDQQGALVGILSREDFGDVDASCLGLVPLPVAERAGLIWAQLTPEPAVDIDTFLCGYDELLGEFDFGSWSLVSRRAIPGPNWKVAYDGYLDLYHLPILHKNTFGPNMPNQAIYDAWGPHQRVTSPNPRYLELEAKPEDEWDARHLLGGVWTIFPHVSIATFDAGGRGALISQLFPGADPDTSVTVQSYVLDHEPSDEERETAEKQAELLEYVVAEEDYATGKRIQKAVKVGARPTLLFGRNEGGGQRFHGWVDRLLDTSTADLPGLFERRG